jgi:hypothetical protein
MTYIKDLKRFLNKEIRLASEEVGIIAHFNTNGTVGIKKANSEDLYYINLEFIDIVFEAVYEKDAHIRFIKNDFYYPETQIFLDKILFNLSDATLMYDAKPGVFGATNSPKYTYVFGFHSVLPVIIKTETIKTELRLAYKNNQKILIRPKILLNMHSPEKGHRSKFIWLEGFLRILDIEENKPHCNSQYGIDFSLTEESHKILENKITLE